MRLTNGHTSKQNFEQRLFPRSWSEFMQLMGIFYCITFFFGPFLLIPVYVVILSLYPRLWLLVIPYYCWVYFDTKVAYNGGRRWNSWANLPMFRYLRQYFPMQVIKTADVSADRNYLMVLYPHGLFPASLFIFNLDSKYVAEIFPRIAMRFVTLNLNFYVPIIREYLLAAGGCSCSETSLLRLLGGEPSKAVIVLAGGATEASLTRPGNVYTIIKSRRKGFVRVALQTGASLVPVFSFNEQNVFDHYDMDVWWLRWFKDVFHRCTGYTVVLPKGRGLFQNRFGLLPRKIPLNTVVGRPIHLPKVENPSKEIIDEYHEKFFVALLNLFEEHKKQYDIFGEDAELIFL